MRFSTLLIVLAVAAGVGIALYRVGHAVEGSARPLRTAASVPARAGSAAAEANLRAAVSAAASYRLEHGSYAGMTTGTLRIYDAAVPSGVEVREATADGYCVESAVAGVTVSIRGPNGAVVSGRC
jgi:hypothetical protein